ncbi:hypothetical protein CC80DRAFT_563232 [Byssothecium circinans]|uniref:DUF7924 domain-containing protein n=1 Tax=Byssothecium circinans TaxID=147558 RepID=A0A6A5TVE3_9PLEO|nr:hypothetical protein CC80DRAFT_563232 [Byssothecium circinans]
MAPRLKAPAAQQRLPMPFSEDKVRQKRTLETEAEPATDLRRTKRPRKLVQQSPSAQQPKGRKRPLDTSDSFPQSATGASRKRARQYPDIAAVGHSVEQEEANKVDGQKDPILYWTKTGYWPKGCSEQSNEQGNKDMNHLLARQKSSGSLRRKQSAPTSVDTASVAPSSVPPSSTTPSDQKPREVKSVPYQDPRYKLLLSTKGSFMEESMLEITTKSKESFLKLLDAKQTVPKDSLFHDDGFKGTCQKIQDRNETRVIRDISLLIVPSAETLATCGHQRSWNNSIPLTGTRPQPDFSVGFRREAFTKEQLDKLAPFVGDFISGDQSYFMATYYMYFPFLTCEVKCGAAALDIADRQNAHSMTLAVRAAVELFRLVGREMEIHREILAFSISHDHRSVRIYGHYPVIDGKDTSYYRHPIHTFDFTALDGRDKWIAYKFTKNVYDVWMPSHFKRLCLAIDRLPAGLDFSVPQLSQSLGLSQDLERYHLLGSSQPGSQSQGHSQQSTDGARDTTPNTSFTGRGASKRPRKRLATEGA